MQEIEYRAWDQSSEVPRMVGWEELKKYKVEDVFINCKEVTLLQYTGLKDKNGKKIFEGDLVYLFGLKDSLFEIINHKSCFGYFITGDFVPLCGYHLRSDVIEVISNVYENPELLKGI